MKIGKIKLRRLIVFYLKVLIIFLQIYLYAGVWNQIYRPLMPIQYWKRGNWAVVGIYAIVLLLCSKAFESLKIGYLKTSDILYSQFFTITVTNGFTYVQLVLLNGKWAIFKGFVPYFEHVEPILRLTIEEFLLVVIWTLVMQWIYKNMYPPQGILFIYGNEDAGNLTRKLQKRKERFKVEKKVHYTKAQKSALEHAKEYDAVLIGDIPSHDRNQILKYCFENNIRCYGVPKLSDIMIRNGENVDLFDTPLLLFGNYGIGYAQQFLKRIMDIVVALLAAVVCAIPMLVIAGCIKKYDHGPVLYKQKRLTKDGKEFDILKFRSMAVNSERGIARLATEHDDRITPIGRVLRQLHLDELPQLFNILKGEMSVVGPRPERKEIAEEYKKEIPEFDFRLKVKAGLTGYAQVYGQYNTTPYDKLKLDLTYIENYSLWMDVKLMIFTLKILFRKEKSEGVNDGKKNAL